MKLTPYISILILCVSIFTSCKKDKDPEEIKKEEDITLNKPHLNQSLKYGTVADIDGNKYATIQIGTQTWMAENLKTTRYNDGTAIPNVVDGNTWKNLTSGAYAVYDNNSAHDVTYGKLYNWYAVNTGKLCPKGWHMPTLAEWEALRDYLGWSSAGGKLKSTISLWKSPNTGATNSSGFSAIPAGCRYDAFYLGINETAYMWSAEKTSSVDANIVFTIYDSERFIVGDFAYRSQNNGYSCRCLKD